MTAAEHHHRCVGRCKVTPPYPHALRPSCVDDLGFIISSWRDSWHRGCPDLRMVRFATYKEPMRRRILALVERSSVVVACDPGDNSHILGWACVEKRAGSAVVHYVYTVQTRREHGLAATMLRHAAAELGCTGTWGYSHATYNGQRFANRQGHDCTGYDPCSAWIEPSREVA